jgi:hypothetical protein
MVDNIFGYQAIDVPECGIITKKFKVHFNDPEVISDRRPGLAPERVLFSCLYSRFNNKRGQDFKRNILPLED